MIRRQRTIVGRLQRAIETRRMTLSSAIRDPRSAEQGGPRVRADREPQGRIAQALQLARPEVAGPATEAAAAACQCARGRARFRRLSCKGPRGRPPRGVQRLARSLSGAARDVRPTCPGARPSPRVRPESHAVNVRCLLGDTARRDRRPDLGSYSRRTFDLQRGPDRGKGV